MMLLSLSPALRPSIIKAPGAAFTCVQWRFAGGVVLAGRCRNGTIATDGAESWSKLNNASVS
jgi:hypothetical protein